MPDTQIASAFRLDLEGSGGFSIILQGGVFRENVVNIANHVLHLRDLFPNAQIIVSISSSDILWRHEASGAIAKLTAEQLGDTILASALQIIFSETETVLAFGGMPLPPIKSDSLGHSNNFNLQLAAAQAGLALARGKYTLRVRNDLYFIDQSFLQYYSDRMDLPRLKPTFSKRLLISSIFSLNPYTMERMPFHYSDWFHFGLTSDIVQLWKLDPIKFADAIYFRTRSHPNGANRFERLFYTRFAVEQHLHYSFYQRQLKLEPMDHFIDSRHRDLSVQILLDDFILLNPEQCNIFFEKYEHTYDSKITKLGCILPEEWYHLATNRDTDPRSFFFPKAQSAERLIASADAWDRVRKNWKQISSFFRQKALFICRSILLIITGLI